MLGPAFVHPSSEVDPRAQLGAGTQIWHFCHIMADARIGDDCVLGQNSFVGQGVRIGNRVRVQNNVSLYAGTCIEDDVFLGPSCVFTNITRPRAMYPQKPAFEKIWVKSGATIGANATILPGTTIGSYAFVGAGAVVKGTIADFALLLGVPAKQHGWVGRTGHNLRQQGQSQQWQCENTGELYELTALGMHYLGEAPR